ncbi:MULTISPECIES: patatin-like phospholipase family protein [Spiribacter]|jgi:NTE family protein|uniref:Patatin n=2 Tax=Spiribacter TaxID=1335745 RepID=A0A557RHF3_9GAMM|nr:MULTISPECIES: patatin-like phospholipase family protein [Spiribacter]KAF0280640.1 patatin [Spiribacter roseus]KAF0282436.1 patatin [Spiribacter roseus]KAF0284256.1 patatin [Spiribacter roseus]TVO64611.1 patatin [Spiribacter aquaticus]
MTESRPSPPGGRIGLALGGGAARGWAHIGVIRALRQQGIEPSIIAGTSVGAIVAAMFCNGRLDAFETWVRSLKRRDVLSYIDVNLGHGGFIQGHRLMAQLDRTLGAVDFADLQRPLGVVATDLYSGQERWLRRGDLASAVRASMALPGLFTPVYRDSEWLADGGLVNPVPISLCHAMGADRVIAVNLSDGLMGRRIPAQPADASAPPGVFDVIATAVNVMQDRITRSRMAGDPPDLLIAPQLAHIDLLELHRADDAIAEGEAAVARLQPAIETFLRD